MPFRLEHEMLSPVEQWLWSRGYSVKVEFHLPWGIADVVACRFNKDKISTRLELGQGNPIGPLSRVELLLRIPDSEGGDGLCRHKLEHELSAIYGEETIRSEISVLIRDNLIETTASGELRRTSQWMPLQEEIVSVELKRTRWKDALYQAQLNCAFSDASFVALPEMVAESLMARTEQEFLKCGVGLLAVRTDGVDELIPSSVDIGRVRQEIQIHAVERFWRASRSSLEAAQH